MHIGCFQNWTGPPADFQKAGRTFGTMVLKCKELKQDPECFQRVCLIVHSLFKGYNLYFRKNCFLPFIEILDISQTMDFYRFLRLPSYFFFPYIPKRLDEDAILNQLEVILCNYWNIGALDEKGEQRNSEVRHFAQYCLTAFLNKISVDGINLGSEEKVKRFLYLSLSKSIASDPLKKYSNLPGYCLDNLRISLKPKPWLSPLIDTVNAVADLACIPFFLNDWSLIDLSIYSIQMGRLPLLFWVPRQDLDQWIWGTMSLGSSLQMIQGIYFLINAKRGSEEASVASWQIALSLAEFLYSSAIMTRRSLLMVTCLAFIAKSLGLLCCLYAPTPTFFKNE